MLSSYIFSNVATTRKTMEDKKQVILCGGKQGAEPLWHEVREVDH